MAIKLSQTFFKSADVVFIGWSRKHQGFCHMVRTAFEAQGSRVHPVNPKHSDAEVYPAVEAVPAQADLAFVLTRLEHNRALPAALAAKGVRRVLFNSRLSVDDSLLAECRKQGLETAVACPMMSLGKGLHRFHGWLSGVERTDARL
ncbi:MAG: CoA-binding protein [Spirochaetes bacterium]|nr:CoA-binding protein [Spirochaetota bacterium]MBU0954756.1 CoA-binding protein [Spirochaetota bacterium]